MISAYGMAPKAVKLLISYLRPRKQRVKIGEQPSELITILKGVPQGSILGPCSFNLFLNDLMFSLKHTNVVNYAVDNTLCSIAETLQRVIQKLLADAGICLDWFAKKHFMLTGNHETQLMLHDVVLDKEVYVNLLHVKIDKGLNFKCHVNEVCRKTVRQLNALRRQSRLLNMSAKMNVFTAFVRANLNYCPLVWIN